MLLFRDKFVNNGSFCYPYIPDPQEMTQDISDRTFEVFIKIRYLDIFCFYDTFVIFL